MKATGAGVSSQQGAVGHVSKTKSKSRPSTMTMSSIGDVIKSKTCSQSPKIGGVSSHVTTNASTPSEPQSISPSIAFYPKELTLIQARILPDFEHVIFISFNSIFLDILNYHGRSSSPQRIFSSLTGNEAADCAAPCNSWAGRHGRRGDWEGTARCLVPPLLSFIAS